MFKQAWFITLMVAVVLAITLVILIVIENIPPPAAIFHVACNVTQTNPCRGKILVFSKTGAFRHQSIPAAKAAFRKLAMEHNVAADFTEDARVFTDANLAQYDAVVFLLTSGEILDDSQQAAFEHYIQSGGGYVGIHSASDTEYDWPWYGGLVGAYFDRIHGHSGVVQATVHVIDHNNPSTMMLPSLWVRSDEWYNFATNPQGSVHVLMTVDERTYKGGVMGAEHPIAWYHEYDGGRAWYTGMGHTSESYSEPLFLAHIWGGIIYAMGARMRSTVPFDVPHNRTIQYTTANCSEISWRLISHFAR
jgi:type 1 glutamine amidotransferase